MTTTDIIVGGMILAGAGLMGAAVATGSRMIRTLPQSRRQGARLLVALGTVAFGGYLFAAWPLLANFPSARLPVALGFLACAAVALLLIRLCSTLVAGKEAPEALEGVSSPELPQGTAQAVNVLFEVMNEALANRDRYTFEHAVQVAVVAKEIGKEMGVSEERLASLEHGCLIHDIGKIAIPDDVLLKPARFTPQDKAIIRYHPLIGAKLVARHIQDEDVVDIILKHHERLSGGGYPSGITGEEIGLLPRIVAVADTFEALVAQRPYKKSMPTAEAIEMLEQQAAAGRLDPLVVKALVAVAPRISLTDAPHRITAGFMENIELFRSRAYFREPLSDFYDYRYLLFLDSAGVLRCNELPYVMLLIGLPEFGLFQEEVSHLVGDQVFDELGQNLLDTCLEKSRPRERYDGSMMLFRMGIDYLVYLELEDDDDPEVLFAPLMDDLERIRQDWGLYACLHRVRSEPGTPVAAALRQLFVHVPTGRRGESGSFAPPSETP